MLQDKYIYKVTLGVDVRRAKDFVVDAINEQDAQAQAAQLAQDDLRSDTTLSEWEHSTTGGFEVYKLQRIMDSTSCQTLYGKALYKALYVVGNRAHSCGIGLKSIPGSSAVQCRSPWTAVQGLFLRDSISVVRSKQPPHAACELFPVNCSLFTQ